MLISTVQWYNDIRLNILKLNLCIYTIQLRHTFVHLKFLQKIFCFCAPSLFFVFFLFYDILIDSQVIYILPRFSEFFWYIFFFLYLILIFFSSLISLVLHSVSFKHDFPFILIWICVLLLDLGWNGIILNVDIHRPVIPWHQT